MGMATVMEEEDAATMMDQQGRKRSGSSSWERTMMSERGGNRRIGREKWNVDDTACLLQFLADADRSGGRMESDGRKVACLRVNARTGSIDGK